MWDEWCCRIVRSDGMSSDLWDLLLLLHLTAPILSHSLICLSRISSPVIFCSDLISTTALFHYSPSIPSSFQFHFHLRSRFLANSSWILCCLSTIVRVTCLYFCTSPQSVDHSILSSDFASPVLSFLHSPFVLLPIATRATPIFFVNRSIISWFVSRTVENKTASHHPTLPLVIQPFLFSPQRTSIHENNILF